MVDGGAHLIPGACERGDTLPLPVGRRDVYAGCPAGRRDQPLLMQRGQKCDMPDRRRIGLVEDSVAALILGIPRPLAWRLSRGHWGGELAAGSSSELITVGDG